MTVVVVDSSLPRVSVCLLTYNRAAMLPRSIDSLLAQSHGDFELIINDDCSTDGTEEVCRSYAKSDPRVRYFKNPTNLTFSGNQNAAILRATSDYVALVHQGDVYRPNLLEKWTESLVRNPSAALVFNALEQADDQGRAVRVYRHPYGPLVRGLQMFDEMIRIRSSPIFGIAMVRRQCVLAAGPFDPRLPILADVDMWLRLLLHHDAAYVSEPLFMAPAREPGTPIDSSNWRVRGEHELIYALNSARRFPDDHAKVAKLRREITPMLWKVRLEAVAFCLWHRRWRAALEGAAFSLRHVDFAAGALPDSVLDWNGAMARLEGQSTR